MQKQVYCLTLQFITKKVQILKLNHKLHNLSRQFIIIFNKIKFVYSQEVLKSAASVVIPVCAALEGKEQVSD